VRATPARIGDPGGPRRRLPPAHSPARDPLVHQSSRTAPVGGHQPPLRSLGGRAQPAAASSAGACAPVVASAPAVVGCPDSRPPARLRRDVGGSPGRSGSVAHATHAVTQWPRWLFMGLIRAYQVAASPFPSPCRFSPSCSTYALGVLDRHGVFRGGWLALRRIARCHPFGGSGYDPVP